jgi:hypothetical protein
MTPRPPTCPPSASRRSSPARPSPPWSRRPRGSLPAAGALAASGMAPRGMDKPEQIMVAIMAGAELGLAPFQSAAVLRRGQRPPTLWGDGLMAVVRARGVKVKEWIEGEGEADGRPLPRHPARHRRGDRAHLLRRRRQEGRACGASRGPGSSTRSGCCRCGPAPSPCATAAPTCCAASRSARRSRTTPTSATSRRSAVRPARAPDRPDDGEGFTPPTRRPSRSTSPSTPRRSPLKAGV